MTTISINKKATYNYELQDKYEGGLVLTGSEVKSIKTGHISLRGSFLSLRNEEIFLIHSNIPPYKFSGQLKNYDPERPRKVLLKKSEIRSLIGKIQSHGLTLIPLRVYTKRRLIKLEFAVAKGKKSFDKRKDISQRESKRKIERAIKLSQK